MEHLKMHSMNKIDENVSKIAQLFPNCVTEAKDENGEITHKIDFDMLKQELSSTLVEGREERYQFTWPDKKQAILTANAPINKTLRPCREESVDFDNTENLYIEGDNLEVLKLLQETYLGKIKMIYIDPPYNTGNDFVYEDNFAQNADEYMANSGQFEGTGMRDEGLGNRLVANLESNGRFHTDWLNMIYPRLKLAKDLLSDDGVIFISIDDNEVENLKKVCDEIFGNSNFVCEFIISSNSSKNNSLYVSVSHEYLICYSKNKISLPTDWKVKKNNVDEYLKRAKQLVKLGLDKNQIHEELLNLVKYPRFYELDHYTYADENGIYQTNDPGGVPNGNKTTEIMHPITKKNCAKPSGGWRYKDEEIKRKLENNEFEFGEDETIIPRPKRYLSDFLYSLPKSITFFDSQGTTKWLKTNKIPFDFPKSYELLKYIISMYPNNSDAIILDFFSGSATTAHAVMQLNAEDGGNRKFIMVQLPEVCDEKSEAFKAGYKNICEIGKERIRRAGQQILKGLGLRSEGLGLRSEGLGLRSENGKELSRLNSLAEGNGGSERSLFDSEETSERGNLCSVGSDEKGGGVNSIEHSGRTFKKVNEGLHKISSDSTRIESGTGNSTVIERSDRVSSAEGNSKSNGSSGRSEQNVKHNNCETQSSPLNPTSSPLVPKSSSLNPTSSSLNPTSSPLVPKSSSLNPTSSPLVPKLDIGFRVLKCDSSNMEDVYYSPEKLQEQDLFKNNVKQDRTAEDLLFQVMLDLGIMLSSKIETKKVDNKTVYYVEGNYLVACFDDDVTEETITKIAKETPYYFVMKDSSMANDSVATNFEQIFTTFSPETIRKVL